MAGIQPIHPASIGQHVRTVAIALITLLLATVAISATSEPAWGDSIQTQIDQANQQLEPIVEAYDKVASEVSTDQAKATKLGVAAGRAAAQVSTAQSRLRPVAAAVYEISPLLTMGALLDSDTSATLLNRLSLADEVAHQQGQAITSYSRARDADRAAQKVLNATVTTLTKQRTDLAAKKHTIVTRIAALNLLDQKAPPSQTSPSKLRPVPCPYTPIGGAAGIAVQVACAQIGKPYVWAAAGPKTFDCSGLTLYAWGMAGVKLRHYTRWQWHDTTSVTRAQLRPGDLVFFFPPTLHHVGIYVGGGWMVNAPHTGDVVRMARIDSLPIGGYRRP